MPGQENVPLPRWREFVSAHAGGGALDGVVTKVVPFGAFVEVADGIEGLLPHTFGADVPVLGAEISVRINRIDVERRRMSLALA
ncbi:S1 RNA-binding domain-containing protein [Amycolatopsis sp. NPDC059021]|uniref:S1 RNA-binding domain-containing protein n=1 Tax=Amycolatopsis sp. NPDC059021 TaxID=3346704 RepID=UPI00366AE735